MSKAFKSIRSFAVRADQALGTYFALVSSLRAKGRHAYE